MKTMLLQKNISLMKMKGELEDVFLTEEFRLEAGLF